MGALAGRRERRQWLPEPPIAAYPGAPMGQSTGITSPNQALIVPAVWSCVQVLSKAVSMLPLETFRRTGDVPRRITDPPVVVNPEAGMTQSEWLQMLMVSLLLRGNAYGLKTSLDESQRAQQVVLLNPDKVRVEEKEGVVRYYTGAAWETEITDRMWHVRGMTLPGSKVGLSPVEYAATSIGVDLSSRKFARDFFDGGGIPKSTLTTDMELTQEQADTAKQRLTAATRNREPAVLGSGIKYTPISVKPEESQFLATQQATLADIAGMFGIAPEMIGGKSAGNLAYTTPELRSIEFLTYGVSFWLKRIEDAFFPVLPQPQFVRFDTHALLRTDAESQAKVFATLIAAKVLPPSRILSKLNEQPLSADEKQELELVPLAVTAQGSPRVNPNASTAGATDVPDVTPSTKPKLGVVNG